MQALNEWGGDAGQSDDITMVVAKITA
jgi:hypothetical protein